MSCYQTRVVAENFASKINTILFLIPNCEFISIDCEFTGIGEGINNDSYDNKNLH